MEFIPDSLKIAGKFGANNLDPDSGYPKDWTGGIHAQDVYAEGKIGTGSKDELKASINGNGDAYFSGNVGIGTDAPKSALHVKGKISSGHSGSSAGAITFYPPDGAAWFHIDNGPAGKRPIGRLRISTGGEPGGREIMSILQDGKVGIETPSPSAKLQVDGTGDYLLLIKDTATQNQLLIGTDDQLKQFLRLRPIGGDGLAITNNGDKIGIFVRADNANVGIRTTNPTHPLHMGGGAYCEGGKIWRDASSREYKKNIASLTLSNALETLAGLDPVTFNYKEEAEDKRHVGFIAEEVPELVASKDKKGLSAIDIVGILTKVVQHQQREIESLKARTRAGL